MPDLPAGLALSLHRPALHPPHERSGVGVAVINFNTTRQTLRCLESLRESSLPPDRIVLLDNASADDSLLSELADFAPYARSAFSVFSSTVNRGFAGGSNVLIARLLEDPACRFVVLLNNDAVALPGMVGALVAALDGDPARVGLTGGRMHRLDFPDEVDTLGITLYASLMPANRLSTADPYLGPTGGCCLLTREVLEDLGRSSGYWFDERFFCYCEDTDLVLRANLLGYAPAYVDELLALHEGQASSGGGYNAFIAYHGIRNSIWMIGKAIPGRLLLKYGALLALAHAMSTARQLVSGQWRLVLRVYRDALRGLPEILRERRRWLARTRLSGAELNRVVAPRFYRQGYWRLVADQLASLYRKKYGRGLFS